jgi:predicted DNA-binding transcriptional regulator YafY
VKSNRLLSVLLLLQTRGRVPATELAARLEVSVRTIYRDVEALSGAGVPVYAERGRHGGIALLPGYRTDVTGLTQDEARALFVLAARGAHTDLGLDGALGSALRKVMAALPAPHRPVAELTSERILVDPTRWLSPAHPPTDLAALQTAVFADRRLRITYRHGNDGDANRNCGRDTTPDRHYTVDPYGLVAKAGVWYLIADHRRTPRLYRVSRVQAATVTPDPVRRRPGADLPSLWEHLRRQVEDRSTDIEVTVRLDPEVLPLFRRIYTTHLLTPPTPDPDHPTKLRATLTFRALAAARPLLAFGAHLEVLNPPEARADQAATARAALTRYP